MKRIFISYSHKDEELLDQLHQHLSALKRQKLIECWTDRQIDAGGRVHDEIDEQLEAADIILLLISPAFLASDYCFEKEMARALEKEKLGLARVIPIILKPVDWDIPELRSLLALPKDGKPVVSNYWHSTDEAFASVAEALRRILVKSASAQHADQSTAQRESRPSIQTLSEAARGILDTVLLHPEPDERGLTEILKGDPGNALNAAFLATIHGASTKVYTMRKRLFRQAVDELVSIGFLHSPVKDSRIWVYEFNHQAYNKAKGTFEDKAGADNLDDKAGAAHSFAKLGSEIGLEKRRLDLQYSREGADMVRKAQDELFDHFLQRANKTANSAPELHLEVKRGEMRCFPNDKMWLNVQGPEGLTLRLDGTRPDRDAVSIARCEIAVATVPLDRYYSEEKARKLEEWTFAPEFSPSSEVFWKDSSGVTLSSSQLIDFAFKHFHSHLEKWFKARRS